MHPTDRVILLREAGNVMRCHTLPHHGEYSVGKHSWDMAMLILVLHPNPSIELLKAVLIHDIGERYTGDVPYPTKVSDGEFTRRLEKMERRAMHHMGFEINLSTDDMRWLHGVDRVEFLLWTKDQAAMGNQNAFSVMGTQLAVMKHGPDIPAELKEFVLSHRWTRTSDIHPKKD